MTTPGDLQGSVALITGASGGIGAAVARDLASAGADVALVARSGERLEAIAEECRALGVRALVLPTDVTDLGALRAAVDRCAATLGGLDILVHSAGVHAEAPVQELDPARFAAVMAVNVNAVMAATRFALPYLLRRGPGASVITIASVAGKASFRGGAAYCASKHELVGLNGSLFEDVREHGVKASVICPGFVDTPMVAGRGLEHAKMIRPEDVARTVRFVATFPDSGCPTEIILRPQRVPHGPDFG